MTRKCKQCSEYIPLKAKSEKVYHKAKFCSFDCMTIWGLDQVAKDKAKKASRAKQKKDEEFRAMKIRVKDDSETIGKLKGRLQKYTNQLAKIVNHREDCISCGKPLAGEKQVDGGHFIAVGQCDAMRFNLMNIFRQCVNCNDFLSGNQLEYERRLREIKGDEYVEYLLEQKRVASHIQGDRVWDKHGLRHMIQWTRRQINRNNKKN